MLSVDLMILAILQAIPSQGHVVVCGSVALWETKAVSCEQKPRCHLSPCYEVYMHVLFMLHQTKTVLYEFYRIAAGHLAAD